MNHGPAIWNAFACRGMGNSASTTGAGDSSPMEAFDFPGGGSCDPCTEDFDCETGFCRDGFCCNDECPPPGRCNNPGFEGLCIDLLPDGEECVDDAECFSTFCRNGVCCKEPCDNGVCNEFGVCESRRPNGDPCIDDDDCDSGVCDDFDGICCNRR